MGVEAVATAEVGAAPTPWWERRWFLALVVLATALPLINPKIPPLVDLPGHIGRYRVELDLHHSPWLPLYYDFHWAVMGNLGIDLLIVPLAPLIGLEPAVKIIVLSIPPLTALGFLWVAREIHGRIPPTAFFALPFIYGFPFLFGFANYALSAALAFLGLGLWLRLGRLGRTAFRSWLFAPISLIVFFCHVYGWGLLGLLCFSAEAVRLHDRGRDWRRAALGAALNASVMALPLLVMLMWPSESRGALGADWFDWQKKWIGLYGTLRDRWGPFDVSSLEFAAVIFLFALISPKLALSSRLGLSAAVLALSFLLLPSFILDSAYADVRLLPYLFAVALLAIRLREPAGPRTANYLALVGIAFFAVRLGATTASLAMAGEDQRAKLDAINHMPRGARVASFYVLPYAEPWALQRDAHLGGLVIARREGFSNDQWITARHNLLELKYRAPGSFASNPSEVVRPAGAHDLEYQTIDEALAKVPRDKFDFIWLINAAPFDPRLVAGLQPVWRGAGSTLYRIPQTRAAANGAPE